MSVFEVGAGRPGTEVHLEIDPELPFYRGAGIGGVLYELATDGPGCAVDEDVATLGERLSLPPFLEPQREVIESHLRPILPIELTATSP